TIHGSRRSPTGSCTSSTAGSRPAGCHPAGCHPAGCQWRQVATCPQAPEMATWHAAWYRSRVELRRRVGTIAFVAMLVALVVGGVLGVAIGDRRNATAFDRYVAAGGGPDLLVTPG